MRRLGGDAWLGLLNESQNEKKVGCTKAAGIALHVH